MQLTYKELVEGIKSSFPNQYPKHYVQNATENTLTERTQIAEGLALELYEHFVGIQPDGYKMDDKPRTVFLPRADINRSIDLMTDYILSDDFVRGLMVRREAIGQIKDDEEYPRLGEGARYYMEWKPIWDAILTDEEKTTRIKVCEICESEFIDSSRRKNAKVCGQVCRKRKDALRNRGNYNENVKGLADEKRLKRDHERQDFEYPFYSPYEMYSLSNRSEQAYGDEKVERALYKRDERYDSIRTNGRRKPMYVGRDEFSERPFDYRPRGRESKLEPKFGPVITRKLSDITSEELENEKFIEADKMRGVLRFASFNYKGFDNFTSEKHAI